MSQLTLYATPGSPPARSVVFLLRFLEIPVEVKILNFAEREQYSDWFLKINPAHQVPTLVHGDFVLKTESRAILRYIINAFKPGSDLYPAEAKARARVDERMSVDHGLFTKNGLVVRPIIYKGQKTVPQEARDGVIESLTLIDDFLSKSTWIAGNTLTIADFSAITIVTTIVECGYDLKQHRNISRWYQQFKDLAGFDENVKGAKRLAEILNAAVDGAIF